MEVAKRLKAAAPEESHEEDGDDAVFVEETRSKGFSGVSSTPTQLERDMYVHDLESDDEDDEYNKTGRVPLHWYEGYDHIGYDLAGRKVVAGPESSLLDTALAADDGRLTVYDKLNGREVTLTPREALLVRRIRAGAFANPETDMYPDFIDFVSYKKEISGLYKDQYEPKRRFVPSKHEKAKIYKIVEGLKSGRIKTKAKLDEERRVREDPERAFLEFANNLWNDDEEEPRLKGPPRLPAPKLVPPGHEESYRPPEEYLPDEDDEIDEDGSVVPRRHEVMRHVGAYPKLVQERFERCLDLYLCPRGLKRKLDIDPESLVPKLPDPNELKPFPNKLCRDFIAPENAKAVTGVGASCDGQFVATVDDAGLVVIWETLTARRISSRRLFPEKDADACSDLAWNPNPSHHVLAIACFDRVVFISTGTARGDDKELTAALLASATSRRTPAAEDDEDDEDDGAKRRKKVSSENLFVWEKNEDRLDVFFRHPTTSAGCVSWHRKGDYAVSVSSLAPPSRQVIVHRCSTSSSQAPLRQSGGKKTGSSGDSVQTARFHPDKPFLFVATKTAVKIFHLTQQKLVKTLHTGCKWISDLDVHPSGDHVLLGSCDKRISWFDLDLGTKAFKTLRYHEKAIRKARFHPRFPLFASCGDDGDIYVLHATVYADLMKSPLILPVHQFKRAHPPRANIGALCLVFHPTQPWLFSGGADGRLRLFHAL